MTGRYRTAYLFFMIFTWLPASAPAQNQIDDEAQSVTAGCHEALKRSGHCRLSMQGCVWGSSKDFTT